MITIECLECGHDHDVEIVRGETDYDDYVDSPEVCEECGAPFSDAPVDERASERRQMGITY